ncbi:MAG: family 10 glycosylhydrolase, partial [Chlorobiales bacterium]|nr:family 10 glycosylhydrolase [Chlorobiales bacterium]
CNAVFFQVRIRGDVLFYSRHEPFSDILTGTLGQVPAYDPVAYAISLARENGLEFHAWFNTMILRGKNDTPESIGVPHLWQSHPDWIDRRAQADPGQKTAYLNPGLPEVHAHLIQLITDFARRYDVDGIQLDDYLRYPTKDFPDQEEYARYNPGKLSLENWRRENINRLVSVLHDSLMTIKPYLRFGVTPIGVYKRVDREPAMESYSDVYQDSREWMRRKKCDYLAPQVYFHTGPTSVEDRKDQKYNPPFENLVRDWGKNKFQRHIYVGIGTYKPAVKAEWGNQVELAREAGAEGVIFYPYNSVKDIPRLFDDYAKTPFMPWKSMVSPCPPCNVRCERNAGGVEISWETDNDVRWVNIYKTSYSSDEPYIERVWGDKLQIDARPGEVIFMTTINVFGNESRATMPMVVP